MSVARTRAPSFSRSDLEPSFSSIETLENRCELKVNTVVSEIMKEAVKYLSDMPPVSNLVERCVRPFIEGTLGRGEQQKEYAFDDQVGDQGHPFSITSRIEWGALVLYVRIPMKCGATKVIFKKIGLRGPRMGPVAYEKRLQVEDGKTIELNGEELVLEVEKRKKLRGKYVASGEVVFFRKKEKNGELKGIESPWADHGDLNAYLRDNELSLEERIDFTRDILKGLCWIHDEKNTVLLDVKPGNMLVFFEKRRKRIRFCDVARSVDKDSFVDDLVTTRAYTPKEALFMGYTASDKIDVWSVGLVIAMIWFGRGVNQFILKGRIGFSDDDFLDPGKRESIEDKWDMLRDQILFSIGQINGDRSVSDLEGRPSKAVWMDIEEFVGRLLKKQEKRPSAQEALKKFRKISKKIEA